MTYISKNIKRLRKKKGLSQNDLAIQLNVTRQTVSGWETDKSYPDLDMIVHLSNFLDTDPNNLIYPVSSEKTTIYREASFKAVIFTMFGFFLAMTFLGGFWGILLQPIIGGEGSETFLYPIYGGIILLSGLIVFCTCIIKEEIRNHSFCRNSEEDEST